MYEEMEGIYRLTEENNNLIEINQELKLDGPKLQDQAITYYRYPHRFNKWWKNCLIYL